MRRTCLPGSVALLLGAAIACAGPGAGGPWGAPMRGGIAGSWHVVPSDSLQGGASSREASLSVLGSRADVPGGCNTFDGEHLPDTDSTGTLRISGTKRFCEDNPDPGEVFRGEWSYVLRDSVLILTGSGGGRLVLRR